MLKKLLLILLMLFGTYQLAIAQNNEILLEAELSPEYPGGDDSLYSFLSRNIVYPSFEKNKKIEGKVLARFVVNEVGLVSNVEIIKSVSPGIDKEVIRVMKMMPKWKPGSQAGKNVSVYYTLPFVFSLKDF